MAELIILFEVRITLEVLVNIIAEHFLKVSVEFVEVGCRLRSSLFLLRAQFANPRLLVLFVHAAL